MHTTIYVFLIRKYFVKITTKDLFNSIQGMCIKFHLWLIQGEPKMSAHTCNYCTQEDQKFEASPAFMVSLSDVSSLFLQITHEELIITMYLSRRHMLSILSTPCKHHIGSFDQFNEAIKININLKKEK